VRSHAGALIAMRFSLAGIIGAVLGLAVGHVSFKATGGFGTFTGWINNFNFGGHQNPIFWAVGGTIVDMATGWLKTS
jgi:hypothetical protein